jgi:hypothetical protein
MSDPDNDREAARIEQLLEDLRSMAAGPVWQRIEELVQRLVRLYGDGLGRILAHTGQAGRLDEVLAARLAEDDLVAGLLLVHGLHPWPVVRRARETLERARPQLQAHVGTFVLVGVEGEVARVRLEGGAQVPAETATRLLHRALVDAAPEIARVELEGAVGREPVRPEALVQIGLPRTRPPTEAPP